MIQEAIETLVEGNALTRQQAAGAMRGMMSGEANPAQMAGFLVALRIKGETIDEITGLAETMRELATPVRTSRSPLVDTCGTGGDHSGTFNISTAAAFVVAGTGVAVAKHGNRSATSKCGSADVLEILGVNIEASPETVSKCIDNAGIGFLFARSLHGAMKHVAPIRGELGLRTVFNILGPLTNPAGACGQVVGVFDAGLVEPLARVLDNLGSRHAIVVAGSDGLDELTVTGPSRVAQSVGGRIQSYNITPEEVGLSRASAGTLAGDDAETNAGLLRAVLEGEAGPRRDIVLFNAAAGILAGGEGADWTEAVETAAHSIDSGAARKKLEALVECSHDS